MGNPHSIEILDEAGKKSLNNSPSNIQLEYVLAKERDVDAMKEAIRADKQGKSIEIIHQPIQEKENYFQADEYTSFRCYKSFRING